MLCEFMLGLPSYLHTAGKSNFKAEQKRKPTSFKIVFRYLAVFLSLSSYILQCIFSLIKEISAISILAAHVPLNKLQTFNVEVGLTCSEELVGPLSNLSTLHYMFLLFYRVVNLFNLPHIPHLLLVQLKSNLVRKQIHREAVQNSHYTLDSQDKLGGGGQGLLLLLVVLGFSVLFFFCWLGF